MWSLIYYRIKLPKYQIALRLQNLNIHNRFNLLNVNFTLSVKSISHDRVFQELTRQTAAWQRSWRRERSPARWCPSRTRNPSAGSILSSSKCWSLHLFECLATTRPHSNKQMAAAVDYFHRIFEKKQTAKHNFELKKLTKLAFLMKLK